MNQRIELPYYFEVPEMPEIPFDVQQYFVSEQQRHEAQADVKTQEDQKNDSGDSNILDKMDSETDIIEINIEDQKTIGGDNDEQNHEKKESSKPGEIKNFEYDCRIN